MVGTTFGFEVQTLIMAWTAMGRASKLGAASKTLKRYMWYEGRQCKFQVLSERQDGFAAIKHQTSLDGRGHSLSGPEGVILTAWNRFSAKGEAL